MTALLFALFGVASAAQHHLGVAIGGHASQGIKTKIGVQGADMSLVVRRQGDGPSGVQLELHDVWSMSPSGAANLIGIKAGWTRKWGAKTYSLIGAGGYANEVMPVLPILWTEAGVELGHGALRWRVGPEIYSLPPFFVGGGLRVTATTSLGGAP